MTLIFVCILLSSYLLLFATTNAAQQKITYNAALFCYVENATGISTAKEYESRVETAVCDFPTKSYRNSITYNYTIPYMVNGVSQRIPLTIEFNETITRNDTTFPLSYVIEGDGIVKEFDDGIWSSRLFKGYHAKLLVVSSNNTDKCDTNGVFTQSIMVNTYLAVFPASLSGQSLSDIRSMLTYTGQSHSTLTSNSHDWFTAILNSTGMVCTGSNIITYAAVN